MQEPEPLYVTCRACGAPVPTGLRLTSAIYEISIRKEHALTCPKCGTTAAYTKAEFHIFDVGPAH